MICCCSIFLKCSISRFWLLANTHIHSHTFIQYMQYKIYGMNNALNLNLSHTQEKTIHDSSAHQTYQHLCTHIDLHLNAYIYNTLISYHTPLFMRTICLSTVLVISQLFYFTVNVALFTARPMMFHKMNVRYRTNSPSIYFILVISYAHLNCTVFVTSSSSLIAICVELILIKPATYFHRVNQPLAAETL